MLDHHPDRIPLRRAADQLDTLPAVPYPTRPVCCTGRCDEGPCDCAADIDDTEGDALDRRRRDRLPLLVIAVAVVLMAAGMVNCAGRAL